MSDSEKEEKPKKAFQIKVVVWEDGEVDTDIREYRKLGTGRGAPTLCGPLNAKEFLKILKNEYGINPNGVTNAIGTYIGVESIPQVKNNKTVVKQESENVEEEIEEEIEEEPDLDVEEEFENMDFSLGE